MDEHGPVSAHPMADARRRRADVPRFTAFLREHAVPTQVWYSAYKGITAGNKLNNDRIRRGLEADLGEGEARAWLRRF